MSDAIDVEAAGSSFTPAAMLRLALDQAAEQLASTRSVYRAMVRLVESLQQIVEFPATARVGLRDIVDRHPVAQLIRQCPFTRHAETKPRGYAGDAELIDYIYRHADRQAAVDRATQLGQLVLGHNLDAVAATAVRNRRRVLAGAITETVTRQPGARILSVACGHAREVELLAPDLRRAIGRFIGFDQDEQSLTRVQELAAADVRAEPLAGHIAQLVRRRDLHDLDLVYATGLYDYLNQESCQKLTRNLFQRLKPGGRLVLANFLQGQQCRGYMELVMDWHLIHRDRQQIQAFAALIDPEDITTSSYFVEPAGAIGFLELVRQ